MIPRRLIRTVPAETSEEVEHFWQIATDLHPGWDMVTFRDPIDPDVLPWSAECSDQCTSGAQRAGFIRLEALIRFGGIYIDSDVQLFRRLDSLLHCSAFACWEDANTVPDAVIGAESGHPAIIDCMIVAGHRLVSGDTDWRTGNGAWSTGPGVTTKIFPSRDDVLLLPPPAFFPVHYTAKQNTRSHEPEPFTFGIHHWNGSWL